MASIKIGKKLRMLRRNLTTQQHMANILNADRPLTPVMKLKKLHLILQL